MGTLTIFRTAFANALKENVSTNVGNYLRDDKWALAIGTRQSRDLPTRVELDGPLDLQLPDNEDLKDIENAICIHKALRHLTRVQARDPRLWVRLCHAECWQYMRKRWPMERFGADSAKGNRFIVSRYFVAQNESRALLRNGIARLWWTAHLSYDSDRTNPYELTAVLLSLLDITQQLLERNMGRAPSVARGFLTFLVDNKQLLLGGGEAKRTRIRQLATFLNMYGGVSVLDCLTETEITKLLDTEFARVLNLEKKSHAATA